VLREILVLCLEMAAGQIIDTKLCQRIGAIRASFVEMQNCWDNSGLMDIQGVARGRGSHINFKVIKAAPPFQIFNL